MINPVIVSAVRTAIGKFQGSLAGFSAPQLGSIVIKEAVERSGAQPDDVDEVLMGNVLGAGLGQAPARQAALGAGLPDSVPAAAVNKVCGSGLKTVMMAAQAIKCEDADLIVAGGMESMTNAPYLLPKARAGHRMGHAQALDAMIHDGLWDSFNDYHMGQTGEVVSERYDVDREAQDRWSMESHRRAAAAIEAGAFKAEIVPVEIPQRKGDPIMFDTDEGVRPATTMESLGKLRAVFKKDGTVTAGNASQISDGAAAVVVCSVMKAKHLGLKPRAEIVAYSASGLAPELVMMAPEEAIRSIWDKTGWSPDEVDLYEINEAFAVQQCALAKQLGIPQEKHNIHGGGVALGHPIGASGTRVLVSLLHAMEQRDVKKGIAALCLGGGNAVAMGIERV